MRTEKEIDTAIQKMIADFEIPDNTFRQLSTMRTTLLWVKGELESLK